MSFDAMAMVVKVEDVSPVNKLILLLLANYADDKNQCYPSYETIAKLANCSKSTAIRSVNTLSELGLVSIQKRKLSNKDNQSNVYTVNDPQKAIRKDIDPSVNLTPASSTVTPPSVKQDVLPSSTVTPPSSTVTPNTITKYNQKETVTKYKGINISKFDESQQVIAKELIDYRKEIKAPLKTLKGLNQMIKEIKSVATEQKMNFRQVTDLMMGKEWRTITNDYSFDKPSNKKGTFENRSAGQNLISIANLAEKQGIVAWENGEVKQSVIDAFENGELELLKLA